SGSLSSEAAALSASLVGKSTNTGMDPSTPIERPPPAHWTTTVTVCWPGRSKAKPVVLQYSRIDPSTDSPGSRGRSDTWSQTIATGRWVLVVPRGSVTCTVANRASALTAPGPRKATGEGLVRG